jgi:hypothetical protein
MMKKATAKVSVKGGTPSKTTGGGAVSFKTTATAKPKPKAKPRRILG